MYENLPGNVNYRNTAGYPPAENVTKAQVKTNANCNGFNATARDTRFGRDTDISNAVRFGNGQWDCQLYWTTNHPNGPSAPSGCSTAAATTITRYQTYLHEVTNSIIPNTSATASPAVAAPLGDDGDSRNSSCYTGGPIPPTPTALSQRINDRRIFTVAGVDCSAISINGNTSNVPVQQYLSMFITEPAGTQGQTNGDVYMEIVGFSQAGGGGLVPIQLREWTELVR
jgi:hypothetical protein